MLNKQDVENFYEIMRIADHYVTEWIKLASQEALKLLELYLREVKKFEPATQTVQETP